VQRSNAVPVFERGFHERANITEHFEVHRWTAMKGRRTAEWLFQTLETAWHEARSARLMPRRKDISAGKLKSCLPYVTLIDVVHGDPIDFRYRLLGQKLIDGFGGNLTGTLHSEHADRSRPTWPFYDAYCRCVATQHAQSIEHEFRNRNKTVVRMRTRVWPLADDGVTVTGLFGGGIFVEPTFG
jgi:hypothetical protein